MNLSLIDRILWVVGTLGELTVLGAILRRRLYRPFPWFTGLMVFCLVRTALLVSLRAHPIAYFYWYWALAVVDVVLEVAVLGEVASRVFCPAGTLSRDLRFPLAILAVGSVTTAGLIAWLADPPSKRTLEWIILRGDLFCCVLISLVFIGILTISARSGFSWNTHLGTIARGLGVYAVFSVICEGLNGYYGFSRGAEFYLNISRAHITGYVICQVYWTVNLGRKVPVSQALPKEMERHLTRMNTYATSLLAHLDARSSS